MLTQIKLTNFKCFKQETTFPLSRFNLFTGVNGSGKTTVLQSLLLMRQSAEQDAFPARLILNGSCVKLGSFDEVRNRDISANEPIFFEFSTSAESASLQLMLDFDDDMVLQIPRLIKCSGDSKREYKAAECEYGIGEIVRDLIERLGLIEIHFISADRIGPQEFYQKIALPKFPHVGTKGELTVNLLDKMRDELVSDKLCLGEDSRTLITQTEAWLGTILNPLKLEVQGLKTNVLELVIGGNKPANVGFGYSIVLPIIVSGLIAKPGEKLIIENPEIHLHPKAQSALIQFLVAVANTGIQVFVESHSDHVLNGIRVAVKEGQTDKNEGAISFHDCVGPTKKDIKVTSIKVDHQGELSEYPTHFFDEYSNQLFKLV